MACGELADVAIEVLGAEMVKDAVIAAFEHSPKALNAIGVGLAFYPVADTMLTGVVIGQTGIAFVLVGVLGRVWFGILADKGM